MSNAEKKSVGVQIREIAEALIIAALFLWFANTFVLKTFYIPSGSMEDTLLIGDHLFVNRFIFGPAPTGAEQGLLPSRPIRRGDVVIFRSPQEPGVDLVKRCVGLPGDLVEIRNKDLYLNGRKVEDDTYTQHQDPGTYLDIPAYGPELRRRDQMSAYRVPEASYFCLGDNRDRSYDSRFWGTVPAAMVKGRASVIYWSFGGDVPDGGPTTVGEMIRRVWETFLGFFTKTRWERSFQLVR